MVRERLMVKIHTDKRDNHFFSNKMLPDNPSNSVVKQQQTEFRSSFLKDKTRITRLSKFIVSFSLFTTSPSTILVSSSFFVNKSAAAADDGRDLRHASLCRFSLLGANHFWEQFFVRGYRVCTHTAFFFLAVFEIFTKLRVDYFVIKKKKKNRKNQWTFRTFRTFLVQPECQNQLCNNNCAEV